MTALILPQDPKGKNDNVQNRLKRELNPSVVMMEIDAPLVAKKALPGQFIILRVDEDGERIPLTVAGTDRERGTVKDNISDSRQHYQKAQLQIRGREHYRFCRTAR